DYRVEWLRFARKMSTVVTQDVHAVSIEAVADVFSSSHGVLFVLDEGGQWLESAATWSKRPVPQLPRVPTIEVASLMVAELLAKGWIIDTEEYQKAPGLYGGAP